MSTELPLFSRPIAVTSTNDSMRVTVNSVNYDATINNGVYPCVRRLAYQIDAELTALVGLWTVAFNASTFKMTITYTGANAWTAVSWTDTALRDLLGYTGSEAVGGSPGAYTLTATYCPSTVWFPSYQPADQGAWHLQQKELFIGATARNGRNVGHQTGPEIFYRSYDFVHEPAARVLGEFSTNAYEYARCLEQFVKLARTTSNNSGAVSCKGFYIYHDMADNTASQTSTMDDGGITWLYSSSPETYVYVHPEIDGAEIGAASMPVSRGRYNVPGFTVHTATAPTWDAP